MTVSRWPERDGDNGEKAHHHAPSDECRSAGEAEGMNRPTGPRRGRDADAPATARGYLGTPAPQLPSCLAWPEHAHAWRPPMTHRRMLEAVSLTTYRESPHIPL